MASDESLKEFEGATLRYASINLRYKISYRLLKLSVTQYYVICACTFYCIYELGTQVTYVAFNLSSSNRGHDLGLVSARLYCLSKSSIDPVIFLLCAVFLSLRRKRNRLISAVMRGRR